MKDPRHLRHCFSLTAALLVFLALAAPLALASHLRGMIISWQPVSPGSRTVRFNVNYSQRWSAPLAPFFCPSSELCLQVGATLTLANLGGFNFGDGSALVPAANSSIAQGEEAFATGDVFVAGLNGKVQWRRPDGQLVRELDTGAGSEATGMAFDAHGNLYVTIFRAGTIEKFDPKGLLVGTVGERYNGSVESIVFDHTGNALIGGVGSNKVLRYDPQWQLLGSFSVATEARGSDWIELGADQCTLYYTSEGKNIKRYNICANEQMTDLTALNGSCAYALRLLPGGGLLLADSEKILRLDASGKVIQTYQANAANKLFFALNLDPDGKSFWSADHTTGDVFKFDIETGQQLVKFNAGSGVGGLAVYREITVGRNAASPPAITTASLPPATASQPYSLRVTGTGGSPPYHWSADLPTDVGLSLNPATGEITGTPRHGGSYPVNVKLTDSQGHETSKTFTLQINAAPQLVPFLLEPERATVGTPVRLVAGLRGPSGRQLGTSELPSGLSLHGEISGTPIEFTSEADGRFTATVTFHSTGNIPVQLRATGDGFDVVGEGIVNVAARFAYAGEPILIDLGQLKAGNVSCKQLPFARDQEGQVPLRFRLLRSTPARHTLFLMRAGESYRPGTTIPLNANDQLEVCLGSGRWAPSSRAAGEPWLALITVGDGGDRDITQIRLTWQVEARSFWERWGWLLLTLLILAVIAFLVYGYIKPQRFPRELALTFVPTYDELDQSPQPLRQWRGVGIGFYRDAHGFLHPDFRISGKSNGALAKLTARKNGVWVTPVGNTIFREVQPAEWEEISPDGRVARATVVYRIGELGPFFRLSSSARRR